MAYFHGSGRVRVTCSACNSVNDLTAVNLTTSEDVTCSRCNARLGKWDSLLTRHDHDRSDSSDEQSAI